MPKLNAVATGRRPIEEVEAGEARRCSPEAAPGTAASSRPILPHPAPACPCLSPAPPIVVDAAAKQVQHAHRAAGDPRATQRHVARAAVGARRRLACGGHGHGTERAPEHAAGRQGRVCLHLKARHGTSTQQLKKRARRSSLPPLAPRTPGVPARSAVILTCQLSSLARFSASASDTCGGARLARPQVDPRAAGRRRGSGGGGLAARAGAPCWWHAQESARRSRQPPAARQPVPLPAPQVGPSQPCNPP